MQRWASVGCAVLIAGASACHPRGQANTPQPPPPSTAPPPPTATATAQPNLNDPPKPPPVTPLSDGARIEDERNTIAIFRAVAPSVVFVTQKRVIVDMWTRRATEVKAGSGTGFIWDDKGHIVTNYHVIRNSRSLSVTLHDQKIYPATVRGSEPRKDIAVLKIQAPAEALSAIRPLKDGRTIEVGQKAIAIGNPFGLDNTITTGIVSALGREVKGVAGVTIRDMVQTDAAINPGNSGGPLLNSAGELIGMNTMIFSNSGASAGIGFAVPMSTIKRVVPQLIENGKVKQVGLGIHIDPMQRLERRFRIKGVVILSVPKGSPADRAGIRGLDESATGVELGDVIVGIGDEEVEDYDDLYNALDKHRAGDEVTVKLVRNGKSVQVKVRLKALD